RAPDPVTELDPNDDLRLAQLRSAPGQGYDGPYLIVNTALNLVHGDRLDWQERKAESFVLTPPYFGSEGHRDPGTAARRPGGAAGLRRQGEPGHRRDHLRRRRQLQHGLPLLAGGHRAADGLQRPPGRLAGQPGQPDALAAGRPGVRLRPPAAPVVRLHAGPG